MIELGFIFLGGLGAFFTGLGAGILIEQTRARNWIRSCASRGR